MITLLSICHYGGVTSVCAGSDVMIVEDRIVVIEQRTFFGWTSLVNVTFSEESALTTISNTAFQGCTNLKTINFPPKLETIGDNCFQGCRSLVTIHLPESLTSLGTYAFYLCSKLASVTADEEIGVTALSSCNFASTALTTFAIWKHLETISGTVFMFCFSLFTLTNPHDNPNFQIVNGLLFTGSTLIFAPLNITGSIVIPATVKTFAAYCCRNIAVDSVSFEEGSQLTSFGVACFQAAKLSTFEFPDSPDVTVISTYMFRDCINLKTITIPSGIKSIGTSAFCDSGVTSIDVAPGHPTFTSDNGVLFNINCQKLIVCPPLLDVDTYTIPKSVTEIAATAFHGSKIPNIIFEEGSTLNILGASAFAEIVQSSFSFDADCPLKTIPSNCFYKSWFLASIELPRYLQSIDGSAFSDTGLARFIIPENSDNLISIDGVLYSRDKTVLYRFPPAKSGGNYEVPSSVETVGSSAFTTCKGITALTFAHDSNLREVKESAFASSSITTVVFGEDSDDVTFEENCFLSSSVEYVKLPGKMQTIKTNLFKDCFYLIGITLPETVTSIETSAFDNCDSLKQLTIPKFCQIRSLPYGAFAGTKALKALELPYLVQTIATGSLPPNIEKLTLWGPPTESVTSAIKTIATLKDIYFLCGFTLDSSDFVAENVHVHHICFTKRISRGRVGKPFIVMTILHL